MSADIEKDYQCLLKHQDVAVDQFQNTGLSPPESLQGLLDAYIAELKIKRQKLREKRKPSKGTNANQTAGDLIDDEDFGAEDECEEDDDDDDNDYEYIEDKLLSQNSTSVAGTASGAPSTAQSNPGTVPSTAGGDPKLTQNQALQNLLNGDSADKSVKKQRVWKKDMLRLDDFQKMREMVVRLRKHRVNEARSAEGTSAGGSGITNAGIAGSGKSGGPGGAGKSIPARTSIQQT